MTTKIDKSKISDKEALDRLNEIDPQTAPVREGGAIRALSEAVDQRNTAQQLVDTSVKEARRAGATWIEIGLSLGVSPQAARQRYPHMA